MSSELTRWVEDRLAEDTSISDEAGLLVLAALEGADSLDTFLSEGTGHTPPTRSMDSDGPGDEEPVGAFLTGLAVEGFRGIGPKVDLSLQPQPGLTIVAGRNGSGKSSLSEALEVALTGSTYRWKKRAAQWREQWRNLHHPDSPSVEVRVAEEGQGQTTIGLSWADDTDDVSEFKTWVQRPGAKRDAGLSSLGWQRALETYRPLMSYDELGGLLEGGPSGLYDALSAALGVEEIAATIKMLDARNKSSRAPEKDLVRRRKQLLAEARALSDERATDAASLLRSTSPDTSALRALATGATVADSGPLAWLRSVSDLQVPAVEDLTAAADRLETALTQMVEEGEAELARQRRRVQLRAHAVELHAEFGDMTCPVCNSGELDDAWAASSRELIDRENRRFSGLDRAARELELARVSARALVSNRPAVLNQTPLEPLQEFTVRARDAWDSWAAVPDLDLPMVAHLRDRHAELDAAASDLRVAAVTELQAQQDLWTPVAAQIAGFSDEWDAWLQQKPVADEMTAALTWLKSNDVKLKNERLAPIAEQARHAWALLRQESNVDLDSVTLEGTATRRRVNIAATVDGEESGALTVMSQGELHALALALFLPRAALPESPFRFVVLDDPVQAMDPAKVDGLVSLLSELAQTRQVIVLSHDDRLPAAARRAEVPVRILEVARGERSQVTVRESEAPARRYLNDAEALVRDAELPDDTLRRVLPGLLRFAVEAAARDRFFAARLGKGSTLHDVESAWASHHHTSERVSLAIFDEVRHDITNWLRAPYRKATLGIVTSAMHTGLSDRSDFTNVVHDAKRFVSDVEHGVRQ